MRLRLFMAADAFMHVLHNRRLISRRVLALVRDPFEAWLERER